jgi:hypothetical protein
MLLDVITGIDLLFSSLLLWPATGSGLSHAGDLEIVPSALGSLTAALACGQASQNAAWWGMPKPISKPLAVQVSGTRLSQLTKSSVTA